MEKKYIKVPNGQKKARKVVGELIYLKEDRTRRGKEITIDGQNLKG
jgi:hypothetical protein